MINIYLWSVTIFVLELASLVSIWSYKILKKHSSTWGLKNSSKWSLGLVYLMEKWQAVNWWWDCNDQSFLGELTKNIYFSYLAFSLSQLFLSTLLLHFLFASSRSCCPLSTSCIYFLPSWTHTTAASVAPIIKIRRNTHSA